MNLHIAPDNAFTQTFLNNLEEAGVLANNRMVIRTNGDKLKQVKRDVPFAPLYSKNFNSQVGNTAAYTRVFIHQFTPLLYRWVALHEFKELNWAVWGADLYNLPFNKGKLYEDLTRSRYVNRNFSFNTLLYRAKVALLHQAYRNAAYGKVKNILTWMPTEYEFARHNLPSLRAHHEFFFYENQLPYQELDKVVREERMLNDKIPTYILGNSATPELNHLDAVDWIHRNGVKANLRVPVSYGDPKYTDFLRKNFSFYRGGEIEFIDRYMDIQEYLQILCNSDGLIMNNIRPQGYGNIFMMMYLDKPVYLNSRNLSVPDLDRRNLRWRPIEALKNDQVERSLLNKSAVTALLSHDNLLSLYRELF